MNPPQTVDQQRTDALVLCALLGASGISLGAWSLVLSLLALACLVAGQSLTAGSEALWGLVVLAGLLERYLAFRLALDQRLFQQFGLGQQASLVALDSALHRLGLRAQPSAERPWSDRLRGTRRLLARHVLVVLLQTAAAFLALFLHRCL